MKHCWNSRMYAHENKIQPKCISFRLGTLQIGIVCRWKWKLMWQWHNQWNDSNRWKHAVFDLTCLSLSFEKRREKKGQREYLNSLDIIIFVTNVKKTIPPLKLFFSIALSKLKCSCISACVESTELFETVHWLQNRLHHVQRDKKKWHQPNFSRIGNCPFFLAHYYFVLSISVHLSLLFFFYISTRLPSSSHTSIIYIFYNLRMNCISQRIKLKKKTPKAWKQKSNYVRVMKNSNCKT